MNVENQATEMVSLPKDVLDKTRQLLLGSGIKVEDFLTTTIESKIKEEICLRDWKTIRFPDPNSDPKSDSEKEKLEMAQELFEKLYDFEDLFADMLFEEPSQPYQFVKTMSAFDEESIKPAALQDFTYGFFSYQVDDLEEGVQGWFDSSNFTLCISTKHRSNDPAILHEMIHLHEFVLNQAFPYYRDIVLCCLYKSLNEKISDLDVELEKRGHTHRMNNINKQGGNHSMLFLLKSLDLDYEMGYPLGTVFAYRDKNDLS